MKNSILLLLLLFSSQVFGVANQKINGSLEVTTDLTMSGNTASRAAYFDSNKKVKSSATVSDTELGYLDGVTSAIQTQIDGKEPTITTLSLAKGGTNKNITASAGQVVYTDGDSFEVLAAGTSGQLLQSNGAAAPSWVTSSANLKTCRAAYGGASATLAAPTVCSTGTCVEIADNCSAFTPPAFNSTGYYTGLAIANGTFANSTLVYCTCTGWNASTGVNLDCDSGWVTGGDKISTNASGGYSTTVGVLSAAGTFVNGFFIINCVGTPP